MYNKTAQLQCSRSRPNAAAARQQKFIDRFRYVRAFAARVYVCARARAHKLQAMETI